LICRHVIPSRRVTHHTGQPERGLFLDFSHFFVKKKKKKQRTVHTRCEKVGSGTTVTLAGGPFTSRNGGASLRFPLQTLCLVRRGGASHGISIALKTLRVIPFSSPESPFLLVTWSAKRRATRQRNFKTSSTDGEGYPRRPNQSTYHFSLYTLKMARGIYRVTLLSCRNNSSCNQVLEHFLNYQWSREALVRARGLFIFLLIPPR